MNDALDAVDEAMELALVISDHVREMPEVRDVGLGIATLAFVMAAVGTAKVSGMPRDVLYAAVKSAWRQAPEPVDP